jgi:hypothetical protein
MTALHFPIRRYLTSQPEPLAPDGFNRLDEPLRNGLPHTIRLDDTYRLVLVVPTGLAVSWREADPAAVISSSAAGTAGVAAHAARPIGVIDRYPARLFLRRGTTFLGAIPLVAGLRRSLPEGREEAGVGLEIILLSWDLRAGCLRGPGDFGAGISLAWRLLGKAADSFSPPPISPAVLARVPQQDLYYDDTDMVA